MGDDLEDGSKFAMQENGLQHFAGWRIDAARQGNFEDCTLIVATYQRPQELMLLLSTLAESADGPSEVVIVDGTPGDHVDQKVREWTLGKDLPFDLIYVSSPAGLTRQRNVGIDISSKEFVFFLDDDCVPLAGYFAEIRRVFMEDEVHKIGAACGLPLNEIDRPVSLRWRLRLALRLVPRIEPGIYHPSGTSVPKSLIKPFSGVKLIDTLSGCAMAFRRKVLDRHRFSEFFYGYSQGEDLEMSLRIRRENTLVWCGDARVIHNHAPGGRPTSFRKGLMEVRNRHFIWRRHAQELRIADRFRFWLDMVFLVAMDFGWFIRYPLQYHVLSHAAGLTWGVVSCLFTPPKYDEPPAKLRYALLLTTARD